MKPKDKDSDVRKRELDKKQGWYFWRGVPVNVYYSSAHERLIVRWYNFDTKEEMRVSLDVMDSAALEEFIWIENQPS